MAWPGSVRNTRWRAAAPYTTAAARGSTTHPWSCLTLRRSTRPCSSATTSAGPRPCCQKISRSRADTASTCFKCRRGEWHQWPSLSSRRCPCALPVPPQRIPTTAQSGRAAIAGRTAGRTAGRAAMRCRPRLATAAGLGAVMQRIDSGCSRRRTARVRGCQATEGGTACATPLSAQSSTKARRMAVREGGKVGEGVR